MLELRKILHIRTIDAAGAGRDNRAIHSEELTALPFRHRP
jgi:hypothetical protein